MNWLDITIIVSVIIGVVHGLFTGIVKQVISLVALVAAVLSSGAVAKWISQMMQPLLQSESNWFTPDVLNTIYYVVAFILILFIFSLVAKLVDKVINFTPVGILNKLLGAVFGLFMWTLSLSIFLNFFAVFDSQSLIIPKSVKEKSIFHERVKSIFPTVFPYIKEFFQH